MNILFICTEDITQPTGGVSNRAYNLAKALKKSGNTVITLQPRQKGKQTCNDEFEIYTYSGRIRKLELYPFNDINPFFVRAVAMILKQRDIDIIHVELPWGVAAVCAVRKSIGKKPKVVYSSQNVQATIHNELARYSRTGNGTNYSYFRSHFLDVAAAYLLALDTQIAEKLAVRLSNKVLCVSDADKHAFLNTYETAADKIILVPNGASLKKAQSAPRDKKAFELDQSKIAIVFHGTYGYAPNREAIRCIIEQVAPRLKRGSEGVEFVIAGYRVPRFEFENVRCLGFVEDIYALLRSSDIAVAPLKKGGGTRLKILDYFAAGLPVVTTTKGIEGIEARDKVHALIVDKIDDLIRALVCLINHPQERERIGANASELVRSQYDWDVIGEVLNQRYMEFIR